VKGQRYAAVVAEDEPVLREQLTEALVAVWPELDIVAVSENGSQALAALEQYRPDVLFLDIEMPGASGLEVARQASGRCHVVFVTAYGQYAVAAFEEGALDYLIKPIDRSRLAAACERVRRRLGAPPLNLEQLIEALARRASRPHLRWINASQGDELRLITVEEVCYFRSDTKYTRVVTAGQESLIRKPLKELLEELDPLLFWQIHRSIIVNVNAIAGVSRGITGHLVVRLKGRRETLAVSQPFAHRFRQM
jgi:DNA-binding LytR/AlgR family response regulator